MGTFKKFCDFCAGIALFVVLFYLLREFLSFSPADDPALREKWRLFIEENPARDYRPYLGLIGLLALALLVDVILRRFPYVGIVTAALPFLQALSMLRDGCLYEHPMFYLVLSALPIVGNLGDALFLDGLDGKHRAFWLANVSSLMVLAFAGLLLLRAPLTAGLEDFYELSRFDRTLVLASEELVPDFLETCITLYTAGLAVSLLLRGAYWLDVLLALPPLLLALPRQIMGTLGPHAELLLALMILSLVCRLAVMVGGTPWGQKENKK